MACYVDQLVNHGTNGGDRWLCILWADELWELHALAKAIGLQQSMVKVNEASVIPYTYELSPSKRLLALEAGAVFMMPSSWIVATRGHVDQMETDN